MYEASAANNTKVMKITGPLSVDQNWIEVKSSLFRPIAYEYIYAHKSADGNRYLSDIYTRPNFIGVLYYIVSCSIRYASCADRLIDHQFKAYKSETNIVGNQAFFFKYYFWHFHIRPN